MRGRLAGSLSLVLGIVAASASAQTPGTAPGSAGNAGPSSAASAVSLGKPMAAPAPAGNIQRWGQGVSLDQALSASPAVNSTIAPVSYLGSSTAPAQAVVRGKSPDEPQRMPATATPKDAPDLRLPATPQPSSGANPLSTPTDGGPSVETLHPPSPFEAPTTTTPEVTHGTPAPTPWEGACSEGSCGSGVCAPGCCCPPTTCCPSVTCCPPTCCPSCPPSCGPLGCCTKDHCCSSPGVCCESGSCGTTCGPSCGSGPCGPAVGGCCDEGVYDCPDDCCDVPWYRRWHWPTCCTEGDPSMGKWWFRGEYLSWSVRHGPAPTLVSVGPAGSQGNLALGGRELFGGPLDYEDQAGGRFTLGYWFDPCENIGIEGTYFFLGERHLNFTQGPIPGLDVGRPFINVATGMPISDAELVAGTIPPLTTAGTIRVSSSSRLWGAEANMVFNLGRNGFGDFGLLGPGRMDFLAGFRYLNLQESLSVNEHLPVTMVGTGAPVETIDIFDSFATRNEFYGGQIGLRREWNYRRWIVGVTGKIAIGDTHESANIEGATIITPAGGAAMAVPGGLLTTAAPGGNIGHHSHDELSVVPEVGVTLGYQVTPHMRAFVGYDFMYWTKVARPGAQIDQAGTLPVVNGNLAFGGTSPGAGPVRPAFAFRESDFWAQGVTFGVEFKY